MSDSQLAANLRHATRLAGRIQYDTAPDVTVSHLAIPASYKRRALVIFGPATGRFTLSNDTPVVLNQGFSFGGNASGVVLRLEDCGDAIQKNIYAIATSGANPFGYIDVQDETLCYRDTPRTNGVLTPWPGHT